MDSWLLCKLAPCKSYRTRLMFIKPSAQSLNVSFINRRRTSSCSFTLAWECDRHAHVSNSSYLRSGRRVPTGPLIVIHKCRQLAGRGHPVPWMVASLSVQLDSGTRQSAKRIPAGMTGIKQRCITMSGGPWEPEWALGQVADDLEKLKLHAKTTLVLA